MKPMWTLGLATLLLGVLLLPGCGGDPPAPKELTPEEEKQFEEARQKERQREGRAEPASEE